MPLKSQLTEDMKNAMRERNALRRDTIRFLLSAIHNEEIAKQGELDDDGTIQVLTRQAQQRRDSIEAYTQGNRQDLADKEQAELEIIMDYLPEQMSGEEIERIVKEVLEEVDATGPQDMGKVMGKLMPQLRGKADGKVVSGLVNELLRGMAS